MGSPLYSYDLECVTRVVVSVSRSVVCALSADEAHPHLKDTSPTHRIVPFSRKRSGSPCMSRYVSLCRICMGSNCVCTTVKQEKKSGPLSSNVHVYGAPLPLPLHNGSSQSSRPLTTPPTHNAFHNGLMTSMTSMTSVTSIASVTSMASMGSISHHPLSHRPQTSRSIPRPRHPMSYSSPQTIQRLHYTNKFAPPHSAHSALPRHPNRLQMDRPNAPPPSQT